MAGVAKQIIGSFEDIGEKIVQETVNVPKDIAGKVMETAGLSGGKKKGTKATQGKQAVQSQQGQAQAPHVPETDARTQAAITRAALEQFAGSPKPKEQSVWEKIQQEQEARKELEAKQKQEAQKAQLPKMSSKRRKGDLYGIDAKKQSSERSVNVKHG